MDPERYREPTVALPKVQDRCGGRWNHQPTRRIEQVEDSTDAQLPDQTVGSLSAVAR